MARRVDVIGSQFFDNKSRLTVPWVLKVGIGYAELSRDQDNERRYSGG